MNSISLEVAEDKSTSLLVWILSDFKAIPLSQLDSLFCSKNRNYFLVIHENILSRIRFLDDATKLLL